MERGDGEQGIGQEVGAGEGEIRDSIPPYLLAHGGRYGEGFASDGGIVVEKFQFHHATTFGIRS